MVLSGLIQLGYPEVNLTLSNSLPFSEIADFSAIYIFFIDFLLGINDGTEIPINDPQITVFIMVDDPDGSEIGRESTGGAISAPIASRIIEHIAPILGIEPSIEEL